MSAKIKLFFSYSHKDADYDTILYFRDLLMKYSEDRIEILMDDDLKPGENIKEYMNRLEDVDGVLLFYTPEYKKRVLNRVGGVDYEYRKIRDRYLKLVEAKNQRKGIRHLNFILIPILFSGDKSSVLDDFIDVKYEDLRWLRVNKNKQGELYINHQDELKLKPILKKILDQALVVNTISKKEYEALQDELHRKLFRDLKDDWIKWAPEDIEIQKKLFVKTFTFRKVINRVIFKCCGLTIK